MNIIWFRLVIVILIITVVMVSLADGQWNQDTLWTRVFWLNDYNSAYSIQQTTDGGYVVAGHTGNYIELYDFYVVKTDSMGDTLWTGTYGSDGEDRARAIRQTEDGGYIVSGYSRELGSGEYFITLLKLGNNGDYLCLT